MKVVIAGSGVMGSGIAICSALAGYRTLLFDIQEAAIQRSKAYISKDLEKSVAKGRLTEGQKETVLELIEFSTDPASMVGDLILEAVLEKLEIKRNLFAELEKINGSDCIFATNTSSIPITQIAAQLQFPERVVGIHFFNPAQIMKLVEVISGVATAPDITKRAYDWAVSLGKTAVLAKDAPGFIVNRVARPYYVEGIKIAEEQVATIESIDRLCRASGFKLGPFQLMDLIGVETNFSVTSSMYAQFHQEPRFRPSRLQQQKADAGHHGQKTGKGFYTYYNET